MARPNKTGLDYFPFDIDFFNDEKISAISGEFGIKGELACIKLLCAIYRNGYFILWNEMLRMKLIKELPGVSADLLDNIVSRLIRWGFFDKTLFDENGILTSKGIQRRYFEITKRRVNTGEDLPYLLVSVYNNGVSAYINPVSSGVSAYRNPQSKGNKSKENKENLPNGRKKKDAATAATPPQTSFPNPENPETPAETDCATPTEKTGGGLAVTQEEGKKKAALELEKREKAFYSSLIPFVEKYPKEMIREFYDYWTEPNKSKTKMRFELQKTWDVSLRLSTWARRDKNFNRTKDEKRPKQTVVIQ
ncbi:MAG: DUF4373 domain-containing protein [Tannerella sp.]|jgi:hypothetical protein|nr:DUF4373 domain-containing protein [Tannerella sp.]